VPPAKARQQAFRAEVLLQFAVAAMSPSPPWLGKKVGGKGRRSDINRNDRPVRDRYARGERLATPQGRGVRDYGHHQAPRLRRAIREVFEHSGFTVQLARVVIIKINVPRQEVFSLDAREIEEFADLKLGQRTLPIAIKGEGLQCPA
jgi:hypothetical protein